MGPLGDKLGLVKFEIKTTQNLCQILAVIVIMSMIGSCHGSPSPLGPILLNWLKINRSGGGNPRWAEIHLKGRETLHGMDDPAHWALASPMGTQAHHGRKWAVTPHRPRCDEIGSSSLRVTHFYSTNLFTRAVQFLVWSLRAVRRLRSCGTQPGPGAASPVTRQEPTRPRSSGTRGAAPAVRKPLR